MVLFLSFPKHVELRNPRLHILYYFLMFFVACGIVFNFFSAKRWAAKIPLEGRIVLRTIIEQDAERAGELLEQAKDDVHCAGDEICTRLCEQVERMHAEQELLSCIPFRSSYVQSEDGGALFVTHIRENRQNSSVTYALPSVGAARVRLELGVKIPTSSLLFDGYISGTSADSISVDIVDRAGNVRRTVFPGQDIVMSLPDIVEMSGLDAGLLGHVGKELVLDIQCGSTHTTLLNMHCQARVDEAIIQNYVQKDQLDWTNGVLLHRAYRGIRLSVRAGGALELFDFNTLFVNFASTCVFLGFPGQIVCFVAVCLLGHMSTIYRKVIYEYFDLSNEVGTLTTRLMANSATFIDLTDTYVEDDDTCNGIEGISRERMCERLYEVLRHDRHNDTSEEDIQRCVDFCFCAITRLKLQKTSSGRRLATDLLKEMKFAKTGLQREALQPFAQATLGRVSALRRSDASGVQIADEKAESEQPAIEHHETSKVIDIESFAAAITASDRFGLSDFLMMFEQKRKVPYLERCFTPSYLKAIFKEWKPPKRANSFDSSDSIISPRYSDRGFEVPLEIDGDRAESQVSAAAVPRDAEGEDAASEYRFSDDTSSFCSVDTERESRTGEVTDASPAPLTSPALARSMTMNLEFESARQVDLPRTRTMNLEEFESARQVDLPRTSAMNLSSESVRGVEEERGVEGSKQDLQITIDDAEGDVSTTRRSVRSSRYVHKGGAGTLEQKKAATAEALAWTRKKLLQLQSCEETRGRQIKALESRVKNLAKHTENVAREQNARLGKRIDDTQSDVSRATEAVTTYSAHLEALAMGSEEMRSRVITQFDSIHEEIRVQRDEFRSQLREDVEGLRKDIQSLRADFNNCVNDSVKKAELHEAMGEVAQTVNKKLDTSELEPALGNLSSRIDIQLDVLRAAVQTQSMKIAQTHADARHVSNTSSHDDRKVSDMTCCTPKTVRTSWTARTSCTTDMSCEATLNEQTKDADEKNHDTTSVIHHSEYSDCESHMTLTLSPDCDTDKQPALAESSEIGACADSQRSISKQESSVTQRPHSNDVPLPMHELASVDSGVASSTFLPGGRRDSGESIGNGAGWPIFHAPPLAEVDPSRTDEERVPAVHFESFRELYSPNGVGEPEPEFCMRDEALSPSGPPPPPQIASPRTPLQLPALQEQEGDGAVMLPSAQAATAILPVPAECESDQGAHQDGSAESGNRTLSDTSMLTGDSQGDIARDEEAVPVRTSCSASRPEPQAPDAELLSSLTPADDARSSNHVDPARSTPTQVNALPSSASPAVATSAASESPGSPSHAQGRSLTFDTATQSIDRFTSAGASADDSPVARSSAVASLPFAPQARAVEVASEPFVLSAGSTDSPPEIIQDFWPQASVNAHRDLDAESKNEEEAFPPTTRSIRRHETLAEELGEEAEPPATRANKRHETLAEERREEAEPQTTRHETSAEDRHDEAESQTPTRHETPAEERQEEAEPQTTQHEPAAEERREEAIPQTARHATPAGERRGWMWNRLSRPFSK
eukprot:TRINITY_DN4248_c0_g1_i1.p1 TRINITY_DN4248_c0_g1~~TRINITY_DN4248_c0_g1_i1.p1  ORF type:complete len:1526 (+),score=259.05 TRINITY_DN4248_c0_g1_i1:33-4610(+)